jgi:hypothetical protein
MFHYYWLNKLFLNKALAQIVLPQDIGVLIRQHIFFTFSLIIEGATEKVTQFKMSLKSIYTKNFGFLEQKNIFEHYRKVNTRKCL